MRRKKKIKWLLLAWPVTLVCATLCILKYIEIKTDRLHDDIRDNIMSLFKDQTIHNSPYNESYCGFFDVVFYDYPVVHYKKINFPKSFSHLTSRPIELNNQDKIIDNFKKTYGDLSSLYALNWKDGLPTNNNVGWCLVRLFCTGGNDDEFLVQNYLFPYQVGLKRGSHTSIQEAVDGALQFYGTNTLSPYYERFRKGLVKELWSKINDSRNEYFMISRSDLPGRMFLGNPIPGAKPLDNNNEAYEAFEHGWMQSYFYRVFVASSQEEKYMIFKDETAINSDRNNLLMWWLIGLTIVFWSIMTPFLVSQKKENKRKKETLKERLCRLCNPKEFVSNYDKERLDTANEIYNLLINLDEDNQDELSILANRAVNELDISLVDESEIEEMRKKANPSKYMEPYDAEKVRISNEAYSLLKQDSINYEDYLKAKSLLSKLI